MERESEHAGGRGGGSVESIGTDDEEFSSVEDTGAEPGENPAVDDV